MSIFLSLYIQKQPKTQTKTSLSSSCHDFSHQSNDLKPLEVIKKVLGKASVLITVNQSPETL